LLLLSCHWQIQLTPMVSTIEPFVVLFLPLQLKVFPDGLVMIAVTV